MGTVVAIAPSPAAAAPEPGLTVDPQSPAGVEYQIPLDTGRSHGSGKRPRTSGVPGGGAGSGGGGANGSAGGGGTPALFGSGITPQSGSGSGSGKRGKGSGGQDGAGQFGGAGAGGSGSRSVPPVTASANYSTTGPIAGVVGAILLVGVGLGVFLRRRNRPRRIFS